MTEEDIRRAADRVRASVKEAIGKVTGDKQIEAEGAAEKMTGKTKPRKTKPAAAKIKNGTNGRNEHNHNGQTQ